MPTALPSVDLPTVLPTVLPTLRPEPTAEPEPTQEPTGRAGWVPWAIALVIAAAAGLSYWLIRRNRAQEDAAQDGLTAAGTDPDPQLPPLDGTGLDDQAAPPDGTGPDPLLPPGAGPDGTPPPRG